VDRISPGSIAGRIEPFLDSLLGPKGLFVVEISLRGHRGGRVLEVFIDGDEGVTTGACAEVSRALSKELDKGPLKGEAYTLTVSSPGLDRPLKLPRQYAKHVGREIRLKVRSDNGDAKIEGTLAGTGGESITVKVKGATAELPVPYASIIEARIKPPW
jgi:ribosome maturation factor RimP